MSLMNVQQTNIHGSIQMQKAYTSEIVRQIILDPIFCSTRSQRKDCKKEAIRGIEAQWWCSVPSV